MNAVGATTRRTGAHDQVTPLEYYAYRLAPRRAFSAIHLGGKLMRQYVVDAYVRVEGQRLNFLRTHQASLRVDLYRGLLDHVASMDHVNGERTGSIHILPGSYAGSPRALQQSYQDAMSIVRAYGRPDLFVTFTCNPRWPEITLSLHPGQTASDRPEIVARVFKMKLLRQIGTWAPTSGQSYKKGGTLAHL